MIFIITLLLGAVVFPQGLHAEVILELNAATLPVGNVTEWKDEIREGKVVRSEAPLRVEKALGRAAVMFHGQEQLVADFRFPTGFEKRPFTIEAWALNPSVDKAEVILSLAPVLGGTGTEFSYSASPSAGAFRSGFKATAPFVRVPSPGVWHHFAWTYPGGGEGALRVYVDGELEVERALKFALPPQAKLHVGASGELEKNEPKKGFSGALSLVRIHDVALTQAEVRQSAELVSAFSPEPSVGSTTESLSVPLRWKHGTDRALTSVVFFSADRALVERGDSTIAQAVKGTSLNSVPLKVGTTYYWRVDDLDAKGQVISPGILWTFLADPGLAAAPQPRDQDSNVLPTLAAVHWRPGKYATQQRLFFGTDLDAVEHATKSVADFPAGTATFPLPEKLAPGTRYYWRIDSDNGTQPASRGQVWTFRTQDAPVHNDVTFFVSSDAHYGRENNAAINRRVIDEMNTLPGTTLPATVGGGMVHTPRGVVLNGDLLDEGFNKETAPALWLEFCQDYGLTGQDGRLCYPVYEGFGNHDGGPTKSFVRAGIQERNPKRMGLTGTSENGLHYSWDWDHVHLAQLNLFGGNSPQDVKGVNGPEHDPASSLDFLHDDLAAHVSSSGRLVIVFQHFAWDGGMSDWWTSDAKERFYDEVKPYHIACLINGHSHGANFVPWNGLLSIHDGSTARGDGDSGDFLVVRVTEKELIVIQRKLGSWGIYKRVGLSEK